MADPSTLKALLERVRLLKARQRREGTVIVHPGETAQDLREVIDILAAMLEAQLSETSPPRSLKR
jgi:hypothetical protein